VLEGVGVGDGNWAWGRLELGKVEKNMVQHSMESGGTLSKSNSRRRWAVGWMLGNGPGQG